MPVVHPKAVKDRFFVVPSFKSQRFKYTNFVCLTNLFIRFIRNKLVNYKFHL